MFYQEYDRGSHHSSVDLGSKWVIQKVLNVLRFLLTSCCTHMRLGLFRNSLKKWEKIGLFYVLFCPWTLSLILSLVFRNYTKYNFMSWIFRMEDVLIYIAEHYKDTLFLYLFNHIQRKSLVFMSHKTTAREIKQINKYT